MNNETRWSIWDNYYSSRDGWYIDQAGRILKAVFPPNHEFQTDAEAEAYVLAQAAAGSYLHERGVAYATYLRLTW